MELQRYSDLSQYTLALVANARCLQPSVKQSNCVDNKDAIIACQKRLCYVSCIA